MNVDVKGDGGSYKIKARAGKKYAWKNTGYCNKENSAKRYARERQPFTSAFFIFFVRSPAEDGKHCIRVLRRRVRTWS